MHEIRAVHSSFAFSTAAMHARDGSVRWSMFEMVNANTTVPVGGPLGNLFAGPVCTNMGLPLNGLPCAWGSQLAICESSKQADQAWISTKSSHARLLTRNCERHNSDQGVLYRVGPCRPL